MCSVCFFPSEKPQQRYAEVMYARLLSFITIILPSESVVLKKKRPYLLAGYVSCEEPTGGGMFRYDVEEMNVRAEMEESYQSTDK